MEVTDASEQIPTVGSGQGLTPAAAYGSSLHASGYHTPDLAIHSSSPGSGSFHTANPMDSERSSLTGHSDGEEWERERRDELSSVEVPSLEGVHTPLTSYQGHTRVAVDTAYHEQEDDPDVTLRYNPSPPPALPDSHSGASGGREEGARNWINQPKLVPAESEAVPPCPEKRPLHEGIDPRTSHNHIEDDRETTPLLPSSTYQSTHQPNSDRGCCVVL